MAKYVSPEGLDDALKAVATAVGSLSSRISNNAQGLQTLSREMPTKVSQLQNDSGYTTNKGTVTGVKINGTTKSPSSGVVDLGTVITTAPTLSGLMGSSAIGGTSSYIYWDGSKWATKSLGTLAFSSATSFPASDVYSWAKASTKPSYTKSEVGLGNVTNDSQVKRTEMGVAYGVATLDANGLVPTSQLPSYVDDVIEGYYKDSKFYSNSGFTNVITGETGKIYVDKTTNKTYRWGGSAYAEISSSLALGTTSSSAYRGDLGAQNATNISTLQSSVSTLQGYFDSTAAKVAKQTLYSLTVGSKTFNGSSAITITKSDLGLGNVENKSSATIRSEITKANVTSALGTGTGTTKYLREDGTWATPPDTNTNTTYSFSGGTNQFTVTPSNGSALTVTITPSISNNVTYSGALTSGQVAVLDGTSGKIKASGYTIAKSVPSDAKFTDTTYEYVSAKQDGSALGLTASGEKYEWNRKQNAISDLSTIRTNASNGNTAYGWGNHASAGYQKASTAITTSNIGSQSVNYATSAGNADTVDGKHASDFKYVNVDNYSYTPNLAFYDGASASTNYYKLSITNVNKVWTMLYVEMSIKENYSSPFNYGKIMLYLNKGTDNSISGFTIHTLGQLSSSIKAYANNTSSSFDIYISGKWNWPTLNVDRITFGDSAASVTGKNITLTKVTALPSSYSTASVITGINSSNYNSYAPKLDGTGASGTWGINIAGNAATATNVAWSGVTGKPSFATVATSGSYNDLSNKPTIPTNTNQLTNGAGFITGIKTLTLSSGSTSVAFNGTSDGLLSISGSNGVAATPLVSGNALTVSITGNNASTSAKGVVQLSDAINSTSTSLAATANAVKKAYDLAASKTSNTGTITQIKVNGTSIATSGVANIPIATSTADGAMSSTHVSKLSSVESAVNILSSEKLDKPSAWVYPSLTLSGATSVSTNPVRYRLCGNLLTIQGEFTYTYGSASDGTLKLFTLPSGYRSSYSHSSWQYATGNWMWRLFIDANGVVYIHSIVHPKNNTTTNSSSMTFLITVSYYLD